MAPWTPSSFAKHNKKAGSRQLKVGAEAANRALEKGKSDGQAVRAGNAAIKAMRNNAKKKRKGR